MVGKLLDVSVLAHYGDRRAAAAAVKDLVDQCSVLVLSRAP